MAKTYQEIFENILNRPVNKMVCKICGTYQSHQAIWCKGCGAKFTYKPKTYFLWIKAIHNRDYQHRLTSITPKYLGAIHRRELKKQNIDEQDFINYLIEKLDG